MSETQVAKRYARALFATAKQFGTIDSVESDLSSIVGLIDNDPSFRNFLLSPEVGREDKVQIAYKLFSDRVTAVTMQALRLILDKRRETEIAAIRDEFAALRREHGNTIHVVVTTSEPMEESSKAALEKKLAEKTGKRVEAKYKNDPDLIGGIRVAYGNYVLDGSIKGSLLRLKDVLKYDLLKQT